MAHWLVGEQWKKTKERKNKRGVWYGKAREQSFTPRTKPLSPSFARHFSCCIPTNYLSALDSGSASGPCWYGWLGSLCCVPEYEIYLGISPARDILKWMTPKC